MTLNSPWILASVPRKSSSSRQRTQDTLGIKSCQCHTPNLDVSFLFLLHAEAHWDKYLSNSYIAYLFFQFYSHNHLFLDTLQEYTISTSSGGSSRRSSGPSRLFSRRFARTLPFPSTSPAPPSSSSSSTSSSSCDEEEPKLNLVSALILLTSVTALAYVTAEYLIESLEGLVESHPEVSKEWITLIIIPILTNAAEHTTAVVVARKGKFDLAMSVAVGSCIQIALFVIPVLVLVAWGMGKPLTLLFDPLETVVLFFSVLLVKFSVEDGKSHWMSGIALTGMSHIIFHFCWSIYWSRRLLLSGVYILIAIAFWHFPGDTLRTIQGTAIQCSWRSRRFYHLDGRQITLEMHSKFCLSHSWRTLDVWNVLCIYFTSRWLSSISEYILSITMP